MSKPSVFIFGDEPVDVPRVPEYLSKSHSEGINLAGVYGTIDSYEFDPCDDTLHIRIDSYLDEVDIDSLIAFLKAAKANL